jgi:cell division septation protein DedD
MAEYDDGAYYEVQLNNKQLVFFFMATLAIAVVVFLCGVMVGRGVHDATLAAAQNDITATSPKTATPEARAMPVAGKPILDYTERLESDQEQHKLTGVEATKSVKSESPENVAAASRTRSKTPPPPPKPRARTLGKSDGAFTIQVVALKTEDAARSLLNRLQQKNYRVYLEDGGEAGLHRVRVGRFSTRAEAETVAQKLRDEERFKPYITQ